MRRTKISIWSRCWSTCKGACGSAACRRTPIVLRVEISAYQARFLLLKRSEASLCTQNPGFPEPLTLRGPLAALVAWWRGDASFPEAQRMGLKLGRTKGAGAGFPRLVRALRVRAHPAREESPRMTLRIVRLGSARSSQEGTRHRRGAAPRRVA